jgi:hypothetical protein
MAAEGGCRGVMVAGLEVTVRCLSSFVRGGAVARWAAAGGAGPASRA